MSLSSEGWGNGWWIANCFISGRQGLLFVDQCQDLATVVKTREAGTQLEKGKCYTFGDEDFFVGDVSHSQLNNRLPATN